MLCAASTGVSQWLHCSLGSLLRWLRLPFRDGLSQKGGLDTAEFAV